MFRFFHFFVRNGKEDMKNLNQMKCEACDASARLLSPNEIESLMHEVSEWSLVEVSGTQKLQCVFHTDSYEKSMSFTNAIAQLAELENHHPLLIVECSTVTVEWWSHKIHGLHKNDFIMAAKTSDLF
jgi:4a-hydroxytetrahydrobiopterin dehydratase